MSFDYKSKDGLFIAKHERPKVNRAFRLALIGVAWISRHYLELYNANISW